MTTEELLWNSLMEDNSFNEDYEDEYFNDEEAYFMDEVYKGNNE